MKPCMIEGCERPLKARGWCSTHYMRWKSTGDPNGMKTGHPDVVIKSQICEEWGCNKPARTRFLCTTHYGLLYEAENPGGIADRAAKRRSQKLGAFVETVNRKVVFENYHGICYMCSVILDPNEWHLEHIIPLSRGGEHSYENTAASCKPCNQRKSNKILEEMI